MQKKQLLNTLILVILFLMIAVLPYDIFFPSSIVAQCHLKITLLVCYLVFAILFIHFTKIRAVYTGKTKVSNIFWLLPLFFIAFTNLFYDAVIMGTPVLNIFTSISNAFKTNPEFEIYEIVIVILASICEEIIFRYVLQKNLLIAHKMIRIFVAAAIFAIFHITDFLAAILKLNLEPIKLLQIVYAFFIGIVLGVLYEYTNNIFVPIAFHILFNLCNDTIYNAFASSGTGAGWPFYVNAICFGAFGLAYIAVFYFIILKKENR